MSWEIILATIILVGIIKFLSNLDRIRFREDALSDDKITIPKVDKKIDEKLKIIHSKLKHLKIFMNDDYRIPKNLYRELSYDKYSQHILQKVSNHMITFMGLENNNVKIIVHNEKNSEFNKKESKDKKISGCYKAHGEGNGEIHIIKNISYSLDVVIALLAHECTHHFLYYNNIKLQDEMENEILTDYAAIYLGFGELLMKGYKKVKWVSDEVYRDDIYEFKVNSYSLGYISINDIAYAVNKVENLREFEK